MVPADFDIVVDDERKVGTFANAFRVVEEAGPDCFLDFMVYSAQESRAEVAVRVRVRRAFMPAIRDSLAEAEEKFCDTVVVGEEAIQ